MTRNPTTQKIARRSGLVAALAALALTVAPAAGMASAPVKFGAKLNPTVQPSNSLPGLRCIADPLRFSPCTMVQNEAYGRPDGGQGIGFIGALRVQPVQVHQQIDIKLVVIPLRGEERGGRAMAPQQP